MKIENNEKNSVIKPLVAQKKELTLYMEKVVENIKKIRLDYGIKQSVIAKAVEIDVSSWSKIERGQQRLTVDMLEKISNCLNMRVIDLFTYPEKYVKQNKECNEKVSVTFEVPVECRDLLFQIVKNSIN